MISPNMASLETGLRQGTAQVIGKALYQVVLDAVALVGNHNNVSGAQDGVFQLAVKVEAV
jgi:hypothetical protein